MNNFPTTQGFGNDLAGALQNNIKVNAVVDKSGINFLKYNTYEGRWSIGRNATDITGEQVIVNTQTIGHGWQLWVDQKLDEGVMVPFIQELPTAPAAVNDKRGQLCEPREARVMGGLYEGDDEDLPFEFTGTSHGIKQAIDTLLNAIKVKSVSTPDFLYPVVELSAAEPYDNPYKKNEKLFNPLLEIVGWCDKDGNMEGPDVAKIEAAPEPEAEDKPTQRRRRKS